MTDQRERERERERERLHLSSPEADSGAARTSPGRFQRERETFPEGEQVGRVAKRRPAASAASSASGPPLPASAPSPSPPSPLALLYPDPPTTIVIAVCNAAALAQAAGLPRRRPAGGGGGGPGPQPLTLAAGPCSRTWPPSTEVGAPQHPTGLAPAGPGGPEGCLQRSPTYCERWPGIYYGYLRPVSQTRARGAAARRSRLQLYMAAGTSVEAPKQSTMAVTGVLVPPPVPGSAAGTARSHSKTVILRAVFLGWGIERTNGESWVPPLRTELGELFTRATAAAFPGESAPPIIAPSKVADYQYNSAMALFGKMKGKVGPGLDPALIHTSLVVVDAVAVLNRPNSAQRLLDPIGKRASATICRLAHPKTLALLRKQLWQHYHPPQYWLKSQQLADRAFLISMLQLSISAYASQRC